MIVLILFLKYGKLKNNSYTQLLTQFTNAYNIIKINIFLESFNNICSFIVFIIGEEFSRINRNIVTFNIDIYHYTCVNTLTAEIEYFLEKSHFGFHTRDYQIFI